MNWLDGVLLLILVLSIAAGFRKGLSHQVIGLLSVVAAIIVGLWTYGFAGGYLAPYLSSRRLANLAGFGLVFCAVLVAGGIVSFGVEKILKLTGLSFLDRVLGAGFGVLRGIMIAVALILGIMAFSIEGRPPDSVVRSRVAPYAMGTARVFAAMAPHEVKEGFRRTYGEVRVAWNRTVEHELREGAGAEKGKHAERN